MERRVIKLWTAESELWVAIDVIRRDTLQLIVPRDRVLVEVLAHSLQYNRLEETIKEIKGVELVAKKVLVEGPSLV